MTYTKSILIMDVSISINIHIDEVQDESVLLTYDGAFGLDTINSGVLSCFKRRFPELSSGIHPDEGHRILISLSEIENAKNVGENITLRDIKTSEDGLRIEFGLKVSGM